MRRAASTTGVLHAGTATRGNNQSRKRDTMLYTIAVVLLLLWLLGLGTSYTMGGFIHILLVIAIVVVLLRVIRGENVLGKRS
jgi:hypothetical protein